jgi:hypothetical protein
MIDDADNLEEVLVHLIRNADPEGQRHPKLVKLLDQVRRNVFLGPRSRAFIRKCVAMLDNVECEGVTKSGRCARIKGKGRCDHRERYDRCLYYVPVRPINKGSPIKLGG